MAKKSAPSSGGLELDNEQIRKAAKGCELLLKERVPREVGVEFQTRYQALRFALAPIDAEHDRLVMMCVKRDRQKQPVREGAGFIVDPAKQAMLERETKALWAMKQRVNVMKVKRSLIPEKVEGKPFVVEGIVWDFLAPILTD